MKGSEIANPGHLIGLKPRRFPNWGARQQPIKICPLCWVRKGFGMLWMVMEIDNVVFEDLEGVRKKRSFSKWLWNSIFSCQMNVALLILLFFHFSLNYKL